LGRGRGPLSGYESGEEEAEDDDKKFSNKVHRYTPGTNLRGFY
jgi:hypothetical protein